MKIRSNISKYIRTLYNIKDVDFDGGKLVGKVTKQKVYKLADKIYSEITDDINDVKYRLALNIFSLAYIMTPVDTGNLRNSAYIKRRESGYIVGYDERKADYCLYVHEIGLYKHKAPTRYKYLEEAAIRTVSTFKRKNGALGFSVKMTYAPLAVYIGIDDVPGSFDIEKLAGVKNKKNSKKLINKFKNDFLDYIYDDDTSELGFGMYDFDNFEAFVNHYSDLEGLLTLDEEFDFIIGHWIDRNRRELIK